MHNVYIYTFIKGNVAAWVKATSVCVCGCVCIYIYIYRGNVAAWGKATMLIACSRLLSGCCTSKVSGLCRRLAGIRI